MRKTEAHFDALVETCRAIVASKSVTQFVVGISTNPTVRRQRYRKWANDLGGSLDGFVILDWGYSQIDIRRVEEHLFKALVSHPNYGVIDVGYKPAVYRKGINADNQVIYLAWWSPYLVK